MSIGSPTGEDSFPFCQLRLSAAKPADSACPARLETWGDHLRKRRLDLGLTQVETAELLGVDEYTVRHWEGNKAAPRINYLPRIVEFLGNYPLPKPSTFPEAVIFLRSSLGLSHNQFGELVGAGGTTVARWEQGISKPLPRTAAALEQMFRKEGLVIAEDYVGSRGKLKRP